VKTPLLIGSIPKRSRRQGRLIRREQRARFRTLREGSVVALGHGKGARVGRILRFHHDLGVIEARVEWTDGIITSVRLDALRVATRKDRRRR